MSKVKENPDSRFLHAEDLLQDGEWKEYTLTIDKVIPPGELVYENKQVCHDRVLCFKQTKKMFALSASCNRRFVVLATGSAKAERWAGRNITVYAARGDWLGQERLAAVRIRTPPGIRLNINPKHVGVDLTGTRVTPAMDKDESK